MSSSSNYDRLSLLCLLMRDFEASDHRTAENNDIELRENKLEEVTFPETGRHREKS